MLNHSLARRSVAAAVGGIGALTLVGGSASAAEPQASGIAQPTAATSSSGTSYTLPTYGSQALMPTWFFGATHLCAFNFGSNQGRLKIQSTTGAAPEYLSVAPFQQSCIDRWWWGVPVWTTNQSSTPLYVSGT